MRISDWSSDVCSSDLCLGASPEPGRPQDPDPVPARQGERAMRLPRSRGFFLALTGLALAVVLLANAHLVYVASTSQPECVPHVRADGTNARASVLDRKSTRLNSSH